MTGYSSQSVPLLGGQATVWFPRTVRKGMRGVILFPGQSNPRMYADGGSQNVAMALAASLARAGIPLVTCEFYGNSWAKDDVINTAIPACRTLLEASFPDMPTDTVGLLGTSMGGSPTVRYSQLHPEEVYAAVGLIPAYDPKAIYIHNDVGDVAMEAAWSFSGLENFPAALDLGPNGEAASSVPLLTAYSSDDPIVPSQSVIDYHELAGGLEENLINLGARSHTIGDIGTLSVAQVARFLVQHGG